MPRKIERKMMPASELKPHPEYAPAIYEPFLEAYKRHMLNPDAASIRQVVAREVRFAEERRPPASILAEIRPRFEALRRDREEFYDVIPVLRPTRWG